MDKGERFGLAVIHNKAGCRETADSGCCGNVCAAAFKTFKGGYGCGKCAVAFGRKRKIFAYVLALDRRAPFDRPVNRFVGCVHGHNGCGYLFRHGLLTVCRRYRITRTHSERNKTGVFVVRRGFGRLFDYVRNGIVCLCLDGLVLNCYCKRSDYARKDKNDCRKHGYPSDFIAFFVIHFLPPVKT